MNHPLRKRDIAAVFAYLWRSASAPQLKVALGNTPGGASRFELQNEDTGAVLRRFRPSASGVEVMRHVDERFADGAWVLTGPNFGKRLWRHGGRVWREDVLVASCLRLGLAELSGDGPAPETEEGPSP